MKAAMSKMPSDKRFTIGELAKRAGLSVETIRFYEHEGLLEQPKRPLGGIRTYSEESAASLTFVHEAKQLGFTLREIRDLVVLKTDPGTDAAAVRGRATAKLVEIEKEFAKIERMRASLRDLLAHCPGRGELGSCPIVQALTVSAATAPREDRTKQAKRTIGMKTVNLTIVGMHCGGCAKTVESLLSSEPGVKAVNISFKDGNARVMFDPKKIDLSALVKAVEKAGYQVPQTR